MDKDLKGLPTIHYTELPEGPSDSSTYREWQTFRHELPRLLAQGYEGKWALIKGDQIIDLFPTLDDGYRAGRARYLFQPFLVQPIREWQPLIRMLPRIRLAALDLLADGMIVDAVRPGGREDQR